MNAKEISDVLINRSLDENLRDLVEIDRSNNNFRLLLVRNNSLVEDYFKGGLTKESFEIEKTKIWDGLLFFVSRLSVAILEKLAARLPVAMVPEQEKMKILYIASSPANVVQLQVGYEFDKIVTALESGAQRDRFELLRPLMSVSLERFLIEKHKHKPYIIHFSGHGLNTGLVFSTENNQFQLATDEVLKEVFKGVNEYAHCIVLNACYASSQGKVISAAGIYVIGMNAAIQDKAAVYLSEKFYRALGNGQDIHEAFFHAKTLLLAEFKSQSGIPELWKDGELVSN